MKYLFWFISFLLVCLFQNIHISHASINFTLTPIKYELDLAPWESITLPASIRNNGTWAVTLPTAKSDFQANGVWWVPSLVRRSELVFPDQELSTWITLSAPEVTIPAWEEWTIDFTIYVPENATPWGHYWAVLFKNPGSESSSNSDIKINVDYGILILVNVEWEIIVDVWIGEPIISGWWSARKVSNTSSDSSQNTENDSSENNSQDTNTWESETNSNDTQDTQEEDNTPSDIWAWYIWDDEQWNPSYIYPDICPLWDFTSSKYDNRCFKIWKDDPILFQGDTNIENNITQEDTSNSIETNNNEPSLFWDDFSVDFSFPIENKGNTHIKPIGKIVLKDENNQILKAIWKEVIVNDRWAIIWEKIVDYIPINDQQGNVLPKTNRIFESEWKGFPYKTYDDEGNQIVNYWSPSEYYTQKNKQEAGFLMFWERVTEKRTHKDITAEIELVYLDEKGNEIEFTTAKDFSVQYIEQEVTLNPYIILALLLSISALIMLLWAYKWWFITIKTSSCWNCDNTMKSSWTACPHCKSLRNKKKQKAIEAKQNQKITPVKKAPIKRKTGVKTKTTTTNKTKLV